MRKHLLIAAVILEWISYHPLAISAVELPTNAVVIIDTTARFQDEGAPLRVLFYEVRFQQSPEGAGVGFVVLDAKGQEVARVLDNQAGLGLYKGTGVYDVTGDNWPEIVMIGRGGAKALSATFYRLQNRHLQEIGLWSGWGVEVLSLSGSPIVAYTPLQYGTLTKLYSWKDGNFVDVSDQFPDFYAAEIKEQEGILDSSKPLPAYLYSRSCALAAEALVYARKYTEATQLCENALGIVLNSPRVTPNQANAPAASLETEREQAAQRIRETIGRVAAAKERGLSRLPG